MEEFERLEGLEGIRDNFGGFIDRQVVWDGSGPTTYRLKKGSDNFLLRKVFFREVPNPVTGFTLGNAKDDRFYGWLIKGSSGNVWLMATEVFEELAETHGPLIEVAE